MQGLGKHFLGKAAGISDNASLTFAAILALRSGPIFASSSENFLAIVFLP
jgi:hypothetical protein